VIDVIEADDSGAQWIWIATDLDPATAGKVIAAGASECMRAPVADASLENAVRRALQLRRLSDENGRLSRTIRVMESCAQLTHCLDAGKLFPVALDLLLQATSRSRGASLFRRETVPRNDSVALRGFGEDERSEICRVLLDEKSVDLEAFTRVDVIDRGVLHDAFRRSGIEDVGSLLLLPMSGEDTEMGVHCLFEEGRAFSPEDLENATMIIQNGEAALRNAETYALAKERAFIDDVTEVYNARYLLSTCENEIQRAERYGNPLSVLFLDLDRFKTVNDRYGHLIGSETLRHLSKLLEQCVRQVDTLARYGGDEFTIVLVDTAHDEAMTIAERIRRTIQNHDFEAGRDARLNLTISIGVASCPEHGSTRDGLLDSADKAMYRAKSDGRNRVCSAADLT
jgi:diguanylate cyclase (GGDEF)-like protein